MTSLKFLTGLAGLLALAAVVTTQAYADNPYDDTQPLAIDAAGADSTNTSALCSTTTTPGPQCAGQYQLTIMGGQVGGGTLCIKENPPDATNSTDVLGSASPSNEIPSQNEPAASDQSGAATSTCRLTSGTAEAISNDCHNSISFKWSGVRCASTNTTNATYVITGATGSFAHPQNGATIGTGNFSVAHGQTHVDGSTSPTALGHLDGNIFNPN